MGAPNRRKRSAKVSITAHEYDALIAAAALHGAEYEDGDEGDPIAERHWREGAHLDALIAKCRDAGLRFRAAS